MYFRTKDALAEFFLEASFFTRGLVNGLVDVHFIMPGDRFEVFFFKKGAPFIFEGLCLAVCRGFQNVDCTFVLRSFIQRIGVECVFSYYYNRLYLLRMLAYRRENLAFTRSKLFFLRSRRSLSV